MSHWFIIFSFIYIKKLSSSWYIQSTSDIYKIKKTTGIAFFFSLLLYSCNLNQLIILWSTVFIWNSWFLREGTILSYHHLSFLPSLSLLKLKQGKEYHFHHLSAAFFLLSSSVLGRRYRLPSSLSTSSFLLSPSVVGRWYHPQPHCSRQGCSSPSRIYPVKTK